MKFFNYKNIFQNKLFKPMFIVYAVLSISLYFFIPNQMDEAVNNYIKKDSLELIRFLESAKMYYNDFIIDDIQQYEDQNKPFSFKSIHKDGIGVLPLPATFLTDLSKMSNPDRITTLYSNYPFKNRKNRILSNAQKRILRTIEKTEDGIIMENEVIDGVDYIRVAKITYMTHDACVKCHNNHPTRMWDDNKWKLSDMRGVLETLTPIDKTIHNELSAFRINIVMMVLISFLILFVYYGYVLLKREDELNTLNLSAEDEYNDVVKKINMKNIALKHNMVEMFNNFDSTVIYSKTNLFGIITEASIAFCKISGYTKEELIGSEHNIVRHKDTRDEVFADLWETIEKNKVWSGEIKNKKKNGDYYWTNTVVSPTYDHLGVKVGYTSIRHDITKDKNKKLKELKLKLKGKR